MGKITGFLEFERDDRDYQPVAERVKHYREFVLPLPEPEVRKQAARGMDAGRIPPGARRVRERSRRNAGGGII